MNRFKLTVPKAIMVATLLSFTSFGVYAWNLPAMEIIAISIKKSGEVLFVLRDSKNPTKDFQCKKPSQNRSQWLIIRPCPADNLQCLASVNRMTSTLVAAKMTNKKVHVQNNNCDVTEVSLKP